MGKAEIERLNQTLTAHLTNIHETLQILDQSPSSSLQKVTWDDVIKHGEQLSKSVTTGSHGSEKKCSVPQVAGTVWEACSALKKTPATNIVAIGRAMTQVAVSMKELEPCSSDPTDEAESQVPENTTDVENYDDFGKNLSPEEMKVANLAIEIVSEALVFIKELIRSITGLLKKDNLRDEHDAVESLEKLLKLCRSIGVQLDELGACLYPPQEFSAIAKACKEMSGLVDEVRKELDCLNGSTEAFSQGCKALKNALDALKENISASLVSDAVQENSSISDVVEQMQNLTV